VKLDQEVYDEIVRRLLSLRDAMAELSAAYEDPAAQRPVRVADQWRGFGGTGRFPQGK
jgi:hypothetical protein